MKQMAKRLNLNPAFKRFQSLPRVQATKVPGHGSTAAPRNGTNEKTCLSGSGKLPVLREPSDSNSSAQSLAV